MGIKSAVLLAALLVFAGAVSAKSLQCAEDDRTHENMCFDPAGVRSNGSIRAGKLCRGGPKKIDDTGFEAKVYCDLGVLELIDRKGVSFARGTPKKAVDRAFVKSMCATPKTKPDLKLKP